MLALAPTSLPRPGPAENPRVHPGAGAAGPRRRMALLGGCAEAVLAPQIHAATIRLLNRAGIDVVIANGEGCCGSLAHHMGVEERALAQARADIDAWTREIDGEGLDAIVVTASGCGATIKDYGYMLRDDPIYANKAARVAALAKDVSEVAATLELDFAAPRKLTVAYHAACSLQHAQKIVDAPGLCCVAPDSTRARFPRRTSVAARPGRTTSCNPKWPRRCAIARSPTSPASSPTSSPPATSAA